ncbi:MAG: hypothetical protein AAGA96_03220 [Verrucomicrobiota bacterium]
MSSFRVRPRFRQVVDGEMEKVGSFIVDHVTENSERCIAKKFPGFVRIRIPENDQHFWTPRLTLSLYPEGENKTLVCGVYGPNANVWGIFLYGYLVTGFLTMISAVFVISEWAIGKELETLPYLIPSSISLVALYLTAQMGQKIASQQTYLLHQAYEEAIGEPIEVR